MSKHNSELAVHCDCLEIPLSDAEKEIERLEAENEALDKLLDAKWYEEGA